MWVEWLETAGIPSDDGEDVLSLAVAACLLAYPSLPAQGRADADG